MPRMRRAIKKSRRKSRSKRGRRGRAVNSRSPGKVGFRL